MLSIAADIGVAAISMGFVLDNFPIKLPIGVRLAATITTSLPSYSRFELNDLLLKN